METPSGKIELACAQPELNRPGLQHVYLAAGRLTAIINNERPAEDATPTISFDAELLYRLAQAIGAKPNMGNGQKSRIVRLWLNGPEKAIWVETTEGREAFGLLMPTRS